MALIHVLDKNTIDKIAAGEVVERPESIVKELVENSMDAGAGIISVEIIDGGVSLIRVTDNGKGIAGEDIGTAFLSHATSKLTIVEDLESIRTLGFRGEALSSIAAVSQTEMITKTAEEELAIRYCIDGGSERIKERVAAPCGTTVTVKNLFYNVPARKKFLKSYMTEAAHIQELMVHLAISRPDISFKLTVNGQSKLETSGSGELKDVIYSIFGRNIASNLIAIDVRNDEYRVRGYIGAPVVSRGNRNFEYYDLNGRYFEDKVVAKAIEDAYTGYMMTHKYPFTAIHLITSPENVDVNAHPRKMEVKFRSPQSLYSFINEAVSTALKDNERVPSLLEPEESAVKPQPSDKGKLSEDPVVSKVPEVSVKEDASQAYRDNDEDFFIRRMRERVEQYHNTRIEPKELNKAKEHSEPSACESSVAEQNHEKDLMTGEQLGLFEEKILTPEHRCEFRIIGQLFNTYWLVEWKENFLIIDQHAAHEKVLYEGICKKLLNEGIPSQMIIPPVVIHGDIRMTEFMSGYSQQLSHMGFEIEDFGGDDFIVRGVPSDLSSILNSDMIITMMDEMCEDMTGSVFMNEEVQNKLASMACKAAVKGNHSMSFNEMEKLLDDLLTMDNPYNCPHGRPVMIKLSEKELEKRFKRIV